MVYLAICYTVAALAAYALWLCLQANSADPEPLAIVEPQDYPKLSGYKWHLYRTKGNNALYVERSISLPGRKLSLLS